MSSYVRLSRIRKGRAIATAAQDHSLEKTLNDAISLFGKILSRLDADEIEVKDSSDLYKIANSFAAIARSKIELDRWNTERFGLVSEGIRMLSARLWEILSHRDPEGYARIEEILFELLAEEEGVASLPPVNEPTEDDKDPVAAEWLAKRGIPLTRD
jgi:hypothetical protein